MMSIRGNPISIWATEMALPTPLAVTSIYLAPHVPVTRGSFGKIFDRGQISTGRARQLVVSVRASRYANDHRAGFISKREAIGFDGEDALKMISLIKRSNRNVACLVATRSQALLSGLFF